MPVVDVGICGLTDHTQYLPQYLQVWAAHRLCTRHIDRVGKVIVSQERRIAAIIPHN